MSTGSTVVLLGIDQNTGLEKRAVFNRLICSDQQKEFTVEYVEQLISPTGLVVSQKNEYLNSSPGEYEQFDALVGNVIRSAIEQAIKTKYGVS